MRGALIVGLALSMGFGYAEAATKKANVSKKSVTKAKSSRFGLVAANTTSSPAAGTTSAPVETVATEVAPKRFGFLIDTWNETPVGAANDVLTEDNSKSPFTAYTLFRPSYKISDNMSVALGIDTTHSWGTEEGNQSSFTLEDPYLMVANSELGTIGSAKAKGYARLYLPFSESSQERGQIAMLRLNSELAQPIGAGLKLTGTIETRTFFQSEDSYEPAKGSKAGTIQNNQWGRLRYYAGVKGKIFGPLSFYTIHGMEINQYYDNSSAVRKTTGEQFQYLNETMLGLDVTENLSIAAGLSDFDRAADRPYGMYSEESSQYVLDAALAF